MRVHIALFAVMVFAMRQVEAAGSVFATIRCRSKFSNSVFGYTPSSCLIRKLPATAPVLIQLKTDRFPYRCDGNNFKLKKDTVRNTQSIVVENGCHGDFEIKSKVSNVDNCGEANLPAVGFRVINGHQASTDCQYPWTVMVYNQHANLICGGSIVDKGHILTAAHCVVASDGKTYDADGFYVYSGSNQMPFKTLNIKGLRERYVKKIHVHKDYNTKSLANDIAILKLHFEIKKYDDCHRPICMVNGFVEAEDKKNCMITGWGHADGDSRKATPQEILQWARQETAPSDVCKSEYEDRYSSNVFCARGLDNDASDACTGDSGGPFVCLKDGSSTKYYQFGIVSAGKLNQDCGKGYGLYTNVNKYLEWILATLGL